MCIRKNFNFKYIQDAGVKIDAIFISLRRVWNRRDEHWERVTCSSHVLSPVFNRGKKSIKDIAEINN